MALESSDKPVDETLDMSVPEGDDQWLAANAAAVDDAFEANEDVAIAAEAIFAYHDQLADMVAAKKTNPVVTGLILHGVNRELTSLGLEAIALPALESESELDAQKQAELALEGIATSLKTYFFQDVVIHFKHWKDIVLDSFKGIGSKVSKYEQKTAENKREFEAKRHELRGGTEVNLHGLWYFFTTQQGQPGNFMGALSKDLGMSTYVLTKYPVAVIQEMEKLAQAVRSGSAKSPASMQQLVKKVEALKSPTELFESSFLGEGKFFNVTGLHKGEHAVGGSRLDQMSRHGAVTMKTSGSHKLAKGAMFAMRQVGKGVGIGPLNVKQIANISSVSASEEVKLSERDVADVFDAAQTYCDNVKFYLGLDDKFAKATDSLGAAMAALAQTAGDNHDRDTAMLGERIEAYGRTLTRAFQSPALQEASRSLRGSKYCNYFGLRAIFNA